MIPPIDRFPPTQHQPRWTRLCMVHGRAYGYHHSDRVRRFIRRVVARALGR